VVDVFDALTSDRPYRPALGLDDAAKTIRSGAGSHFDPRVVDAFFRSFDEILDVRDRAREPHAPIPGGHP